MPTLNWIGKEAVVKHHSAVPFRLLEPVPELSCSPRPQGEGPGVRASDNLIVQGDNLHALKALLPPNRMGGRAAREGITYKQTPYALEV